jgi:uncharacterized protein (TIGR03000 family)
LAGDLRYCMARVLTSYAEKCPAYQSVKGCIECSWGAEVEEGKQGAAASQAKKKKNRPRAIPPPASALQVQRPVRLSLSRSESAPALTRPVGTAFAVAKCLVEWEATAASRPWSLTTEERTMQKTSLWGVALVAVATAGLFLTPGDSLAQRRGGGGGSGNYGQQPVNKNAADFVVRVPDPNAEIWFQDHQTRQRGTVRNFESADLQSGKNYTFHIKARWMQNGQPVEQTRDVQVQAGQRVNVDFTGAQAQNPGRANENLPPRQTENRRDQNTPPAPGANPSPPAPNPNRGTTNPPATNPDRGTNPNPPTPETTRPAPNPPDRP